MSLLARIKSFVGIPRQTAPSIQTGPIGLAQLTHHTTGEVHDGVPIVQQFGFASVPLPGCDHVTVSAEGDRTKIVSIATNDQRFRITGMATGEARVYDSRGQRFYLREDGAAVVGAISEIELVINDVIVGTLTAGGLNVMGNVVVGSGASGSFADSTGSIVTVQDGIITNIY